MAKTNPSVILLKGDPIYKEYALKASVDITPGMLVELDSTGVVKPHATAAALASPIFAVEGLNKDPDSMTMGGIDDKYDTDGQAVKCAFCKPGDEIYALLEAGAGNTTAIGTILESNGAGLLQVGATSPVARALEVVDNDPGVGGAAMRVRVEVL